MEINPFMGLLKNEMKTTSSTQTKQVTNKQTKTKMKNLTSTQSGKKIDLIQHVFLCKLCVDYKFLMFLC